MYPFFSKNPVKTLTKLNPKTLIPSKYAFYSHIPIRPSKIPPKSNQTPLTRTPNFSQSLISRSNHTTTEPNPDSNPIMNEFLSRFVFKMRKNLVESYPDCDKPTIDGMILVIVEKVASEMEKGGIESRIEAASMPSGDLSEDLWKLVWELSNSVLEDMSKERKKEKLKVYIQCDEVRSKCRFAGEAGVRGEMLRELRFKWAREKMEDDEFNEKLKRIRDEDKVEEEGAIVEEGTIVEERVVGEEEKKTFLIPQRQGTMKYKIYGLDLSDPKWAEVADRVHESGEILWPQEAKAVSGKCKLVMERIMLMNEEEDPSKDMKEWIELLEPSRVDWIALLDRLKEQNMGVYYKIAEFALSEASFQPNIRDYSKLIDAHARENRLEDAERVLKKMNENGIVPDILTTTVLVHMYSKAGNIEKAKEAFENLRNHGFKPDAKVYNSMIMAYVNSGQPRLGESLVREMEARDIKPTEDIYMALLRAFSKLGDVGAVGRISSAMQFAGIQPSLEFSTLLVEAHGRAGNPDQARSEFDYMLTAGIRPDDRCTASMIAAYQKKNLLDKALDLLLTLEKDGLEPGVMTYTVLVDWLSMLQLVGEAEQLLRKITEQGETPPFKVHVGLCDMYSRAGVEKKALQSLGVLESRKDELGPEEFERTINGLIAGGFLQDATRMSKLMEGRGFKASESLQMNLSVTKAFGYNKLKPFGHKKTAFT